MSSLGTGLNTVADIRARCVVDLGGCWRWTGAYAANSVRGSRCPYAHYPATGRSMSVLRVALLLTGKQPGAITWRSCCSDSCVNPAHLLSGSRAEWGQWVEERGVLRGKASRRAANRRAKLTKGAKFTSELAQWAMESQQSGVDLAHGLGVSPTSVSRVRLGRTWAPLASPFAGLGEGNARPHRPGPGSRARAANAQRMQEAA